MRAWRARIKYFPRLDAGHGLPATRIAQYLSIPCAAAYPFAIPANANAPASNLSIFHRTISSISSSPASTLAVTSIHDARYERGYSTPASPHPSRSSSFADTVFSKARHTSYRIQSNLNLPCRHRLRCRGRSTDVQSSTGERATFIRAPPSQLHADRSTSPSEPG